MEAKKRKQKSKFFIHKNKIYNNNTSDQKKEQIIAPFAHFLKGPLL